MATSSLPGSETKPPAPEENAAGGSTRSWRGRRRLDENQREVLAALRTSSPMPAMQARFSEGQASRPFVICIPGIVLYIAFS
jgi:hypothetical protein